MVQVVSSEHSHPTNRSVYITDNQTRIDTLRTLPINPLTRSTTTPINKLQCHWMDPLEIGMDHKLQGMTFIISVTFSIAIFAMEKICKILIFAFSNQGNIILILKLRACSLSIYGVIRLNLKVFINTSYCLRAQLSRHLARRIV